MDGRGAPAASGGCFRVEGFQDRRLQEPPGHGQEEPGDVGGREAFGRGEGPEAFGTVGRKGQGLKLGGPAKAGTGRGRLAGGRRRHPGGKADGEAPGPGRSLPARRSSGLQSRVLDFQVREVGRV